MPATATLGRARESPLCQLCRVVSLCAVGVAGDEPHDEWDDEESEARVAADQASVEQVLLTYVPEGAESLRAIHERWKDDGVIGVTLLLAEFGAEFLMPELNRHKRATEVVRKVYRAAEQLLADEEMLFRDAAYFGLIEPLGPAVHYLSPEDVGSLVGREIRSTYPAWPGGAVGPAGGAAP